MSTISGRLGRLSGYQVTLGLYGGVPGVAKRHEMGLRGQCVKKRVILSLSLSL